MTLDQKATCVTNSAASSSQFASVAPKLTVLGISFLDPSGYDRLSRALRSLKPSAVILNLDHNYEPPNFYAQNMRRAQEWDYIQTHPILLPAVKQTCLDLMRGHYFVEDAVFENSQSQSTPVLCIDEFHESKEGELKDMLFEPKSLSMHEFIGRSDQMWHELSKFASADYNSTRAKLNFLPKESVREIEVEHKKLAHKIRHIPHIDNYLLIGNTHFVRGINNSNSLRNLLRSYNPNCRLLDEFSPS